MAKVARVCLTGPESTGKTTLAERLAAHFGTVWVPEFSREYAEGKPEPLVYDDVEPIANGQIALEERVTAGAAGLVILDTDILSSVVYSRFCYGSVPERVVSAARARLADRYLLFSVDVPYVDDPVRSSIEDRHLLFVQFQKTLDEFGVSYSIVSGDWEERFRRSVEEVGRVLFHAETRRRGER
jgi:NadR type nicotinamide-nucleotide adenylyltransferase